MSTTRESTSGALTRRGFLRRVGAGVGAVAVGGLAPPTVRSAYAQTSPQVFGRMFPNLPIFAPADDRVRAALVDIGKPRGLLDARDDLAAGPVDLVANLRLSRNNPNNDSHTAGTTFMGQFLDHDMTFDTTSPLGVPTPPEQIANARTPSFDLDSVYGAGPAGSPQLYNPGDRAKLRIESGGIFEDLPRDSTGRAIIADPRNDENLMIAGLHAAFILFHNNAVDRVRSQNPAISTAAAFQEARRLTTWHYHWLILKEFLPLFVGQAMVDDVLRNGRRFYRPPMGGAFMPVEFQGAAYRFGHSMVRPSYRANKNGDPGGNPATGAPQFFGMIFDPAGEGQSDPVDLRGGARAPRRFIGWETFFRFNSVDVRPNKLIDTHLSTPLFNLPLGTIPDGSPPTSLPQRNLLRGLTWSLPSGQAIAQAMGVSALSANELNELGGYQGVQLHKSTPLFYYVLKEAELRAGGLTLGPVGGRIVAEVFIGLLQTDPGSWVATQPSFTPTLGSTSGTFTMLDFLTFAGVDPASRAKVLPA
jgi:Animal haem peroxidase